jgi:hypothetical protein
VSASLFDRSALAAAFAGHDAVVNLASAIPPMRQWMSARAWRVNDRVRIQGSAAVVDAALAAGVGRVIQESVSMLYRGDQGDRWVDEDAPIDRYPMARGNLTEIPSAPELYIPPAKHGRQGKPRKDGKPSASRSDGLRAAMQAKLASITAALFAVVDGASSGCDEHAPDDAGATTTSQAPAPARPAAARPAGTTAGGSRAR